MGKKRRILNNPKFAFLKKIRFLKSFADEEQAQEQVAVVEQKVEEKIEQPKPVLKADKPKAKLSSKKTTTRTKASVKKGRKPATKK
tara:strand:- start:171 stop:428 length:258 start_codon:yes stop_codon:yes gene_type:complete